jgi:imidazolonepropionase
MNTFVDLIVDNIGQLCTLPSQHGPQRGGDFGTLGMVEGAALAIRGEKFVAYGPRDAVLENYAATHYLDAGGRVATPGLIDPHTHLVWAGDRADEFEQRLRGATYLEIAAAGGGINRTVRQTRSASLPDLVEQTGARLQRMLRHGTTTVEVKTGYGLNLETELTLLNAIALLDTEHPIDLIPTFLGAHDIPPEFADSPDAYVDLIVEKMLPAVAAWKAEHWPGTLYCDAFCEKGVFTLPQTERILRAAKAAGFALRLHADEFVSLGGTALAVNMGAVSVDHLLATTPDDVAKLAASETVAVLLPATPFGLGIPNTAPARALIDAGAAIALATDCNPGTAWCESMQFVMALATRALKLSPAQALAAATVNAAYAVGRGGEVGSVAAGQHADLVLWDVDDYRHLAYRFGTNLAHTVIKAGRVVWQGDQKDPA